MQDQEFLLNKASRYCGYRDRCQQEVRKKLQALGASPDQTEEVLAELINLGFVNEERFAQLYAGGKFRQKCWGRNKIKRELQMRNLTEYCIESGLAEIEESEYRSALKEWVRKKRLDYGKTPTPVINQKIANFCIQKGYEPDLVWEVLAG